MAVGFRRLSIFDLAGGAQPLWNEAGDVAAFLNGEVFNFRELRRDLEAAGHRFRTNADTEVLPHLYEEHGLDLFPRLNGMFAIVIWDSRRRRLALARDPLGIKPLYLARQPGRILFGSELKGLFALGAERRVSPEGLEAYLTLRYCPEPMTLAEGVEKLPAGCMLVVEDGRVQTRRWYDLWSRVTPEPRAEARRERFFALLADAVRLQLEADVPVGVQLSGGLDSSLLTGAAAAVRAPETFFVRFAGSRVDESPYVRAVVSATGARHHEIPVSEEALEERIEKVVWFLDDLVGDSAAVGSLLISEFAARSVTVLLSGCGGDELFAGYEHHLLRPALAWLRRVPGLLRRPALAVAGRFHEGADLYAAALDRFPRDPLDLYLLQTRQAYPATLARYLRGRDRGDGWRSLVAEKARAASGRDAVGQALSLDLTLYLRDQLLPLLDRTTMAASIEGRVPLLDHRLVELMSGVSGSDLVGWPPRKKSLMRRWIAGRVPDALLDRPKQGFGGPVARWLHHGLDARLERELAAPGGWRDLLDPAEVRRDLAAFRRTGRKADLLFSVLLFLMWHRAFIDEWTGRPPAAARRPLLPPEEAAS